MYYMTQTLLVGWLVGMMVVGFPVDPPSQVHLALAGHDDTNEVVGMTVSWSTLHKTKTSTVGSCSLYSTSPPLDDGSTLPLLSVVIPGEISHRIAKSVLFPRPTYGVILNVWYLPPTYHKVRRKVGRARMYVK